VAAITRADPMPHDVAMARPGPDADSRACDSTSFFAPRACSRRSLRSGLRLSLPARATSWPHETFSPPSPWRCCIVATGQGGRSLEPRGTLGLWPNACGAHGRAARCYLSPRPPRTKPAQRAANQYPPPHLGLAMITNLFSRTSCGPTLQGAETRRPLDDPASRNEPKAGRSHAHEPWRRILRSFVSSPPLARMRNACASPISPSASRRPCGDVSARSSCRLANGALSTRMSPRPARHDLRPDRLFHSRPSSAARS